MALPEIEALKRKEREVGKKASRVLQGAIHRFIGFETVQNTGALLKSTVKERWKLANGLTALVIKQPRYGFMLNYGFEGVKSNGVQMKLNPTNHLADGIERSGVLETLATELTDIKGEQVLASIDFKTRGD